MNRLGLKDGYMLFLLVIVGKNYGHKLAGLVEWSVKFKTMIFLDDKLILSGLTGKIEISELSEIYR